MILNWAGVIIGFGAVLLGNHLEGGHIDSLIQPTAAIIVFGGTFGCTLLAITMSELIGSIKASLKSFISGSPKYDDLVKEIVAIAATARKDGLLALEGSMGKIKNPFLAKNLRHIIDGYDGNVVKALMEDEMHHSELQKNANAKVFETAGGFAPTIGILGAVLGLIHVMSNLSDSSKLGAGIAVAFVATVYGVGAANLFLIPLGNKLKKLGAEEMLEMEIIYQGLSGLQDGQNPRVIEDRLKNLVGDHGGGHGDEQKKAA